MKELQKQVVNATLNNAPVKMTSVELVDLINRFRKEEGDMTEKRHDNLLRDIKSEVETLKNAGIAGALNFEESTYVNDRNKVYPCYSLTKAGVLQMLNKESAVVRYRTVQYIEKLEKMNTATSNELAEFKASVIEDFTELKAELKAEISEQIQKLAEQGRENHRPSHKTKLDYNNIIKSYSCCKGDENVLKTLTLKHFKAEKWEDIPYDKNEEVIKYIRKTAEEMGMFTQTTLFD